jgi:phenylpropionate dioxygenase-like ring-hydroxylating dioxygenase large terminal subunit
MRECPIPLSEFEASVGERAVSLPAECFTSPEFYEFELDAVWGHDWFCVGRATDVPNTGDYYPVTVGDDPLMIVRGHDDVVRVISAVCQHRGFVLAEKPGNAKRIRCPYHAWTYDLDGRLRSAPLMDEHESFDKSCVRLPEVRSEIWEGFVFVTFDPDVPPISERLAHLSQQLANYRLSELRAHAPLELESYEWNWKVVSDECYHCCHLHATTFHRLFPSTPDMIEDDSPYDDIEHGVIGFNHKASCLDGAPTRTGKALHPILPDLTEAERWRMATITIAPNVLLLCLPDRVQYFLALPTGPTSMLWGVSWLFPESTLADPGFVDRWELEKSDLTGVREEDLGACLSVQRGLRSRFAPRGSFSPKEWTLIRMNEWLVSKYMAASSTAVVH